MLLSISFTDSDGVVYHLVHDIDEKDFDITTQDEDGKTPGQVEIIGWMYQYYNIEPKDETFALLKKNVKITKERIPAATQLFTPDWIVRYMVENSLGRLWVEGHPNDSLKENWKYYLEEAEQESSVQAQLEQIRAEYRDLNPEDIKVIDPCMGSGHILVYCFDVLMQIYESQGYTQRDAAQSILENNLYGLDIDKRAAQLAYFAVMMKARQYDRRIFTREIKPHVYAIEESNGINRGQLKYFGADLSSIEKNKAMMQITDLLDTMIDAKEYGSILSVENYEWNLLERFTESIDDSGQMTFDTIGIDFTKRTLSYFIAVGQIIAQKYDVVVTNPPYLGISTAGEKLNKYVKDKYYDAKEDLYLVFIEKCNEFCKRNRFQAMITQHSWMFLSRSEKLRLKVQDNLITTMAHFGARAFEEISGEVVQTTSFVLQKSKIKNYIGRYKRLVAPTTQDEKEKLFLNYSFYDFKQDNYKKIPGEPIVYWISNNFINNFSEKSFDNIADSRVGLDTGNNDKFLRLWFEPNYQQIEYNATSVKQLHSITGKKYVPHTKGGEYRKWYGNFEYVIAFDLLNYNLLLESGNHLPSRQFYFLEGMNWTRVSSKFAVRYTPAGMVFNSACPTVFVKKELEKYTLALLNSCVVKFYLDLLSPTINFQAGDVGKVPYIYCQSSHEKVNELTDNILGICKEDWDAYETSWDFKHHPLIREVNTVVESFEQWQSECDAHFNQLKANEEELNRIFIDIYRLQDELKPEVEDKDVTVRKADLSRDIRSLISYAVGCMFGRYSLDESGICYAGGEWDDRKYSTFIPDNDNCIPITDEEYFEDDIVALFVVWIKKVYGAESLEENLDFIAKALGNKGATSREVIRNYFLNDFMKDHIKIYQKRPIYWLFDSGKQKGFKALVYMHRWNADTVGNLRVEYLHKMQHIYEREIARMQETIDNSRNSREISKATKRKDKLQKQLKETKDYDAKLAHIALSRIEIDLDDGVKVNYEKVQTARDGKKMQILAKI